MIVKDPTATKGDLAKPNKSVVGPRRRMYLLLILPLRAGKHESETVKLTYD